MKSKTMLHILASCMLLCSCSDGHLGLIEGSGDYLGESWITNEEDQPSGIRLDIGSEKGQLLRFGIDAERLWYFWPGQEEKLAVMGVTEIKADYVRVAIDCAYEREEGEKRPEVYEPILNMMRAMKKANPQVKLFASPRPLQEAYSESEIPLYFASENVPWTPYPAWIWINNQSLSGSVSYNRDKHVRYYADYLNLMHENGFDIDYMDFTNEKQLATAADMIYLKEQIASHLDPGVKLPLFIAPSTYSVQQGVDFLKPLDSTTAAAFDIASTHNTGDSGVPEEFVSEARRLGKEVWNTEMHSWTGTQSRDEIINSRVFWEYIRSGFTGIDTWLFYGPADGKDHTMLWTNWNGTKVTKSVKYHIFKKVVNTVNLGNYVASTISDQTILPTVMRKGNTLLVCLYNPTSERFNQVTIKLPETQTITSDIRITYWTPSTDNTGISGLLDKDPSSVADHLSVDVRPESVTCLSFEIN